MRYIMKSQMRALRHYQKNDSDMNMSDIHINPEFTTSDSSSNMTSTERFASRNNFLNIILQNRYNANNHAASKSNSNVNNVVVRDD